MRTLKLCVAPQTRVLAIAVSALLAGCGGSDHTDNAASGNAAAGQAAIKRMAIFSNRQKVGEVVVPKGTVTTASARFTGSTRTLADTVISPDLVGDASSIDPAKSLLITSLGTVNDPRRTFDPSRPQSGTKGGVWSFGGLMRQLAQAKGVGAPDENTFARAWISSFLNPVQAVPGEQVAPRPALASILADWEKRSGVQPGGKLDLDMAPFRLMAIVNRIDLRDSSKPGNAGEGRFIFCAIDPNGNPLDFTVIFEYGVQLESTQEALQAWARKWADLGSFQLPQQQDQYNAALQAITNQIVLGAAPVSGGPISTLNHVRTNEDLAKTVWELREFVLDSGTGLLKPVAVTKTPQIRFQNTALLGQFINENVQAILSGAFEVPAVFNGQVFASGIAPTPSGANAVGWNVPPNTAGMTLNPEVRRVFSLNTCSGCHHRETNPAGILSFTHVKPRGFDTASKLSMFMTGKDDTGKPAKANDPVTNTDVEFNDLERRAVFLDAIISNPVTSLQSQQNVNMVH